jgi:pimeloyl-ACP methyl ester carboxylesterase
VSSAVRPSTLAVTDEGAGPAVVLLHGQPGVGRDWRLVTERLAQSARVLVPDRPGYGRTAARAAGVAANAETVVRLLDQRGIARAVVVGHSWAGAVVLDLVLRFPARVAGMVLVASVGGPGSVNELDRVLSLPVVGPALSLAGFGVLAAPRVRRRVAQLLEPAASAVADGLAPHWVRSWRSFVVEQRALVAELPEISRRVGPVAVPAAVVIGEADRIVKPASQRALASRLGASVVGVPAAGHLVALDAPDAVASVIAAVAGGRTPAGTL